jgi:hypothetical protein
MQYMDMVKLLEKAEKAGFTSAMQENEPPADVFDTWLEEQHLGVGALTDEERDLLKHTFWAGNEIGTDSLP